MTKRLSWRQKLVLRAASSVDYLPFDAPDHSNIPYGVYGSLVDLRYMRKAHDGWELTPEGRALNIWWTSHDREEQMKEKWMMSHQPRFFIRKSADKWVVLDRLILKERSDAGPVAILRTRREARDQSRRMNVEEQDSRGSPGLISTERGGVHDTGQD